MSVDTSNPSQVNGNTISSFGELISNIDSMFQKLSDSDIQSVWEKGKVVTNNDPDVFRQDVCGAWIAYKQYGNRDSAYGWEIDHIQPQSHDGSDSIYNLRPLHWKNNASKSDGRLVCVVKANRGENVGV